MPKQTFFNLPIKKQKRILNSTRKVYSIQSYKQVTIDKIVDEANIPKGSFYQYFDNKEDLFVHLFFDLGIEKFDYLLTVIDQSEHTDLIDLIYEVEQAGYEFDRSTGELSELRNRFFSECPQDIMRKIIKRLTPKTYSLYEYAIVSLQQKNVLPSQIDKQQVSFIVVSCLFNIERYNFSTNDIEMETKKILRNATSFIYKE